MNYLNFSEVAETDNLRSKYIFENVFRREVIDTNRSNSYSAIPKQLIQYWDDTIIPDDVKKVMDTWTKSGMPKIVYNRDSAKKFISDNFSDEFAKAYEKCIHPAMRSDYFRLCYLYKKGGLYVDVDDKFNNVRLNSLFENNNLKVHPLCYDLSTDQMVRINDFYHFSGVNPNYIYYVNNDPILAPAKHPLIELALNRATYNLLDECTDLKDIQSIAGPGNFSASVVQYFLNRKNTGSPLDFEIIMNWDDISNPQWNLKYRKDQRNWRKWLGDIM
ncbi:glycosyltransferase family 32 protein [Virgibacillus litoralis]|uniref:Mannosyltransferase OCH1-like enzyme n=1 Tax=Virgibacillus litoralis TaxID=578221 RepID=A0ABS4H9G7_9BACI|nr:glycosyltransferase [Virgibacillus litoralis]MBP1947523.1 mannosyltransferase OCH1-like enzyme [Virgibacillus litoralis]